MRFPLSARAAVIATLVLSPLGAGAQAPSPSTLPSLSYSVLDKGTTILPAGRKAYYEVIQFKITDPARGTRRSPYTIISSGFRGTIIPLRPAPKQGVESFAPSPNPDSSPVDVQTGQANIPIDHNCPVVWCGDLAATVSPQTQDDLLRAAPAAGAPAAAGGGLTYTVLTITASVAKPSQIEALPFYFVPDRLVRAEARKQFSGKSYVVPVLRLPNQRSLSRAIPATQIRVQKSAP